MNRSDLVVSLKLNAKSLFEKNHMCFVDRFVIVAGTVVVGNVKSLVGFVSNYGLGAAVMHCGAKVE